MRRIYAILAIFITLSLVTAPVGAAMAAAHATMTHGSEHSVHSMDEASMDDGAMSDMTDCTKMAGSTDKPKCHCCDANVPCSADMCLAKCFKIFGNEQRPRALTLLTVSLVLPYKPERPPDWVAAPLLPPPRS